MLFVAVEVVVVTAAVGEVVEGVAEEEAAAVVGSLVEWALARMAQECY